MRISVVTAVLSLTAFGVHYASAQSCDDLEEELRVCRLQELSPLGAVSVAGLDARTEEADSTEMTAASRTSEEAEACVQ